MRPEVILLAVWAVACADSGTPSPPEPQTTGCEVVAAGPPAVVQDPGGPYYHQMALAHTTDGVTLTGFRTLLDHASVPDGVQRADGAVLAYYVNGADGAVFVARIEGDSAVVLGPLVLNGVSRPGRVVDPDVYRTSDGRIRLAYFNGFGPPSTQTARAMCIAESSDGLSFTLVGRALAIGGGEQLTDPSVVRLPDGSWRMAVSLGQNTVLARSADGLAFQRYDTLTAGGVPELALTASGGLRLYVCSQGIRSLVSPDGGTTWQAEVTVVPPGTLGARILCDPSRVAGTDLFLFKTAP